jgi:hypothetical protein
MSRTKQWVAMALAFAGLGLGLPAGAQELELSEAELFFELNHTDEDLGIHAAIDGGPYSTLEIEDPRGRTILYVESRGRLRSQGLTQLSLESAEPDFEELAPEDFFRRFPEGLYEIEIQRGSEEAEAEVELSHVLPAPAPDITVNTIPAAESCDDEDLPVVVAPVLVDWGPVEESHPDVGDDGDVEIVRYQFFTEQGDTKFGVDLPPDVTQFRVPEEITAAGGVFKFEIIARASNLNNTAVETCFAIEE